MRFFFMFAPAFIEWPIAMAREIQQIESAATFAGIYRGGKDVICRIAAHSEIVIDPLYSQADLEEEWLRADVENERLLEYEARFDPGFFKRIVVSDRKMGYGYVNGGVLPPSRLSRLSSDHESVQRYFYGMVSFLETMLLEQKITHVFCYCVAGSVALSLKELCFHHGIVFRQIVHTRVETRCILDDASPIFSAPVYRLFQKSLKNPSLLEEEIPHAENYLERLRQTPTQPGYMVFCQKELKRQTSFSGILYQLYRDLYGLASVTIKRPKQELEKTHEWDMLVFNLQRAWRLWCLKHWNPFQAADRIPKRPYAYYPLHVDPEASTMVLAPMHVNQIHVIEALSKSIPLSWNLLVKEHLPMIGKRPAGFYDQLLRIPGVYLLQPWENNFDLIQNSRVVCTITGTAGWESLVLGKPTVVLGNAPYTVLEEGMVLCPDLSRLPQAIQTALSIQPADPQRILLYAAAIFRLSFPFPSNLLWGKVTSETVNAHREIARAIVDRLLDDEYCCNRDTESTDSMNRISS